MNRSELLITYGHRILESNQFANAKDQKHHFRTDVASHSINVALFCIAFYQLLSLFHIKLNLATLIIAALAHDLGIIDEGKNFLPITNALRDIQKTLLRRFGRLSPRSI